MRARHDEQLPSLFLCSPLLSPIALFLSLISFHSPTLRISLSFFLSFFLPLLRSFTFHVAVRLLPLYAFDAIILRPLWRLVNSANPLEGRCITTARRHSGGDRLRNREIYYLYNFFLGGNGEVARPSTVAMGRDETRRNHEGSFRAQRDIYLGWLMVNIDTERNSWLTQDPCNGVFELCFNALACKREWKWKNLDRVNS